MHGGASDATRLEDQARLERLARRVGLEDRDSAVIAQVPLFAGLEASGLADLLAEAVVRCFSRNALLFIEGEPAGQFYVVLDGWVRLYRQTTDGRESVIALLARGESFAEAAMFLGGRFPVSAAVVDEARLLVIPAKSFRRALQSDTELCFRMMASMALHLRRLVGQVEQLTVRSSSERVAQFLLKLARNGAESAIVQLPYDKGLIAARLGMQPETLSRALAKLRPLGVDTHGSRVTIRDIAALRRHCVRPDA
jgi:CRP/FNR family transcriptional regulator, dissimilatory nitrate respiration regulator